MILSTVDPGIEGPIGQPGIKVRPHTAHPSNSIMTEIHLTTLLNICILFCLYLGRTWSFWREGLLDLCVVHAVNIKKTLSIKNEVV